MVARLLVPASDDSDRGALARVERLERRIGIDAQSTDRHSGEAEPRQHVDVPEPKKAAAVEPQQRAASPDPVVPAQPDPTAETAVGAGTAGEVRTDLPPEAGRAVSLQQLRDAWPEILEVVQKAKRTAWMVVYTSTPRALNDDVLTLSFPSETDVTNFKERPISGDSVSEQLRSAITAVLGIRVKFVARVDAAGGAPVSAAPAAAAPAPESADGDVAASPPASDAPAEPADQAPSTSGWNVTPIPGSEQAAPVAEPVTEPESSSAPKPTGASKPSGARMPTEAPGPAAPAEPASSASAVDAARAAAASSRYGEAVVRELLGASFIEEQNLAPRDRPVTLEPSAESAPGSGD